MEFNLILPPVLGFLGLLVAFLLFLLVMRFDGGSDEVKKIGDQIHLGAMVFMRREYSYLALFVAVLIVLSLDVENSSVIATIFNTLPPVAKYMFPSIFVPA